MIDIDHPSVRAHLAYRQARCPYCKRTEPSSIVIGNPAGLAFFQYRGPGSNDQCDVCGVVPSVHDGIGIDGQPLRPNSYPMRKLAAHPPHEFTCVKGQEFDSFYCGCRGWD